MPFFDKKIVKSPLGKMLESWLPASDFLVIEHGFSRYGRDYVLVIEDCISDDPGQHELLFTHVVYQECATALKDHAWKESWSDEFIDHNQWEKSTDQAGYFWGCNYSSAYSGLSDLGISSLAKA